MIFYIILGFVLAVCGYWAYEGDCLGQFLGVVVVAFGIISCNQSDWWSEYEKADAEKRAAEYKANVTPRKVSEADGCTVYTFSAGGRWQYFTRCEDRTTTTNDHSVSCGKNCSKTEQNDITTENGK